MAHSSVFMDRILIISSAVQGCLISPVTKMNTHESMSASGICLVGYMVKDMGLASSHFDRILDFFLRYLERVVKFVILGL